MTGLDRPTPIIAKRPTGRFKVYWQWSGAVGFGRGSNFRYEAIKGQPSGGFDTIAQARKFESDQTHNPTGRLGPGSHLPESAFRFCLKCGETVANRFDHRCATGGT